MIGFSPHLFDKEKELGSSSLPLRTLLSNVMLRNTGNIGLNTEFRGVYDGKEVIMLVARYMTPSNDEIRMGLRNKIRFGNFSNEDILKLTISDINVRNMSIEEYNQKVKYSNHI